MLSAIEFIQSRKESVKKLTNENKARMEKYESESIISIENEIENKITTTLILDSKKPVDDKFESISSLTLLEEDVRILMKFDEIPLKRIGDKLKSLGYFFEYKMQKDKYAKDIFNLIMTVRVEDSHSS